MSPERHETESLRREEGLTSLMLSSRCPLINPNKAFAYGGRGLAYGNKGEFDQAIGNFSKAIELDPNHSGFYFQRAVAYGYKQEYDLTWQDVHKAQELGYKVDPQFLKALRELSGRDN